MPQRIKVFFQSRTRICRWWLVRDIGAAVVYFDSERCWDAGSECGNSAITLSDLFGRACDRDDERFGSFVRRNGNDVFNPAEIGVYRSRRVAKCVETGWVLFPANGVIWCGRGRLRLRREESMLVNGRIVRETEQQTGSCRHSARMWACVESFEIFSCAAPRIGAV